VGVEESVRRAHDLLAGLLRHEHASLALAQRCSGVRPPAPLFTALLNYRHNAIRNEKAAKTPSAIAGIRYRSGQERTNYPIVLSVEDFGEEFGLTAHTISPLDPQQLCSMMNRALEQLVDALGSTPEQPIGCLDVLPSEDRNRSIVDWEKREIWPEVLGI
jgi:hypothetical protein